MRRRIHETMLDEDRGIMLRQCYITVLLQFVTLLFIV